MDLELERKNNDHLRPFWKVLGFVVERNKHLLNVEDENVVDTFLKLSEYGKFLFVRMFDRNYTDNKEMRVRNIQGYIGDSELFNMVLEELVKNELVVKIQQDDLPTILDSLTGDELKSIAKEMKVNLNFGKKKNDVIKAMLKAVEDGYKQTTFGSSISSSSDNCAKNLANYIQKCHGGTHILSNDSINTFIKVYQIYYYDCGYDDKSIAFSRLYLSSINQRQYFQYKLSSTPLFNTMDELLEYQEAVMEEVYWGDDNRTARLTNPEQRPVVKRLDDVVEKVEKVVKSIGSTNEGRFTSKYVWMKVAVKIGSQSVGALGKCDDKTKVLFRQYKLLTAFLNQSVYAQHKLLVALSSKIHVQTELFKTTSTYLWLERGHEDVNKSLSIAKQERIVVDPLMLDLDKKVKKFQAVINKERRKKSQKRLFFKPLVTKLIKIDETLVVGKTKIMEIEKEDEEKKVIEKKPLKQSKLSEYYGANAARKKDDGKKRVETVVIYSSGSELSDDEEVEIVQVKNQAELSPEMNPLSLFKQPWTWASEHDNSTIRVETVSLEHYEKMGYRGWHDEGLYLRSIFVLLFWDIIFSENVTGVFYNHVQTAPLDMYTSEFYTRRSSEIAARLSEIDDNAAFIENKIRDVFTATCYKKWDRNNDKYKVTGPYVIGVNYERCCVDDLITVAKYLGPKAVRGICSLLAKDYYKYDSGLPDLCIVNDQLERCKMIEVKSKNDCLSDTQKVWIHHMKQLGVDVEVCRVLNDEQYNDPKEQKRRRD